MHVCTLLGDREEVVKRGPTRGLRCPLFAGNSDGKIKKEKESRNAPRQMITDRNNTHCEAEIIEEG